MSDADAPASPAPTEPGAGTPDPIGPPTDSAAPSVRARVLAFASIVAAGAAGGFIGWAIVDLQCEGDCTVVAGLVGLVTAVAAAVGVGVVAVLALRAIAEWQATEARGSTTERDPGLVLRRTASTRRQVPRVR